MNFLNNISYKILTVNNFLSLIIILVVFSLDRISKIKIIQQSQNSSIFINDFLNLELVWNTGIGFGLFNLEAGLLYHLISTLILIVLLIILYFILVSSDFDKYLYSLVFGGAAGNIFDRLNYFAVPDFIDFHINNYHWFTFNIADIFISLGIILIILKEIIFKHENK
jgi:signal peptidase II